MKNNLGEFYEILRHLLKCKIIGLCEKQLMKNVEKYYFSIWGYYHYLKFKLHHKCNLMFDLFSFYKVLLLNNILMLKKSVLYAHPHTFLNVSMSFSGLISLHSNTIFIFHCEEYTKECWWFFCCIIRGVFNKNRASIEFQCRIIKM